MGITQDDRLPLLEYSPDIHKVIEHVHSNLQQQFSMVLREDATINPPQQYVSLLLKLFHELQQASIKRDVKSLKGTLQAIIDIGGDWPEKRLR